MNREVKELQESSRQQERYKRRKVCTPGTGNGMFAKALRWREVQPEKWGGGRGRKDEKRLARWAESAIRGLRGHAKD